MTKLFGTLGGKAGQRGTARLRLGVPGSLVMTSGTQPCLIDNISASGARLRCEASLSPGTPVELRFEELRAFGAVAWMRGVRGGVRFDTRLTLDQIEYFRWIAAHPQEWAQDAQSSAARAWYAGVGRLN